MKIEKNEYIKQKILLKVRALQLVFEDTIKQKKKLNKTTTNCNTNISSRH